MTLTDPTARPEKLRKPTGAKVLTILGAVLLVAGLTGAWSGAHRVQRAADRISQNADDVRAGFLSDFATPGSNAVELTPGRYTVYSIITAGAGYQTTTEPDQTVVTDASGEPVDPAPTVTVTASDGTSVPTESPGLGSLFSGAGANFFALRDVAITTPGTYRVEVGPGDGDRAAVGPAVASGDVARVVTGGLLALLASLVGGLGFVLGLAGLIWLLVADTSPKPTPGAFPPLAGAWGAPAPGPWGAPPPGSWGAPSAWTPPNPGWAPAPGLDPRPAPPGAPPPPPPSHTTDGWVAPPTGPPVPPTAPPPAPWGDAPPMASGDDRSIADPRPPDR